MSTDVWDAYCDWLNAPSGSTKEEAMKVQHRSKDIIGIEWEAVDEAKAYYIVKDPAGFLQVLDKKDYEPVQEWVDVTAQCTIETDCHGRYSLFHKNKAVFVDDCKYRVTPNGAVVYKVERKR